MGRWLGLDMPELAASFVRPRAFAREQSESC